MQPGKLGARWWCLTIAGVLGSAVAGASMHAQTVVGTPQQANDRIKALSASARTSSHDYIIGSGDTLSVEVFDVKEFTRDVRVSQTGTIGLPLVPVRLYVKGLTETQAEQKIAEVLEANGLVSHPEVTVAVRERKSKPITILGAVPHPMVYQADRQVTLLEVLAEAGGVTVDAGDTAIVTRPVAEGGDGRPIDVSTDVIPPLGGSGSSAGTAQPTAKNLTNDKPESKQSEVAGIAPIQPAEKAPPTSAGLDAPIPQQLAPLANTITVNLNDLMETGDIANNIVLQAGDIVTVPHAGIVYVLGAVGRPGGYVLANDRSQMTALKMLALSGGLNRTAKSGNAVIIRKDNEGKQHEQMVDLHAIVERKAEDVRLQASDILYVPESTTKRVLGRASELAFTVASGVALYRLAYR